MAAELHRGARSRAGRSAGTAPVRAHRCRRRRGPRRRRALPDARTGPDPETEDGMTSTIVQALLLRALDTLPTDLRARYEQEWRADLAELSGMARLVWALGLT